MRQRDIDLFNLARCELLRQVTMRGVVARDQNHAASEPVQAMHDPRPQLAPHARKLSKTMQHRVDQRPSVPAGARVNHHARGFVDGDDVGILIQDLQRQILRRGPQQRQFARLNLDALGAFQQMRSLFSRAIHLDAALVDPILQSRPAVLRKLFSEELVEPFVPIRRVRFQPQVTSHSVTSHSYIQ